MWIALSPLIVMIYGIILGALAASIFIIFNLNDEVGLAFINPNVLYKTGKINWFGAYFLAILFSIIFLPVAICYWIYKLCTIGRR